LDCGMGSLLDKKMCAPAAVASVRVCTNDHIACFIGDTVVWVICKIIKEPVAFIECVLCC
jgi:hypothetical protein